MRGVKNPYKALSESFKATENKGNLTDVQKEELRMLHSNQSDY